MTLGGRAVWLPGALLLLWLPGSFPVSGPSTVNGTVGGSLSVQCWYEEKFQANNKFWCRGSLTLLCDKIGKTTESEREVRSGRVSISDHPANLTFTVTMEGLTLEDAGAYLCGVDTPWHKGFDPSFQVQVSVFPAPTSAIPTDVAKTSTTRTKVTTVSPTSLATESATHGPTSQEDFHQGQGSRLPVLLSFLALLLLLLVGSSLLAWRMFRKRVKGEHSELSQNLRQAAEQSEPQYANLQLQTWSLREDPAPPGQEEVEYSLVGHPREDLHYSTVVFDSQKRNSNANGVPSQGLEEGPEYSVIRKPRDGPLSPP